jgi:hypothetical protein
MRMIINGNITTEKTTNNEPGAVASWSQTIMPQQLRYAGEGHDIR